MRTRTLGVVVLSGVVLVGVLSLSAQTAPALTAQDYAEIQQLYARYAHGIDAKIDDGWMYARVFTEDGVLDAGAAPREGHQQIREVAKGWDSVGDSDSVPRGWHFTTNIMIEPTPEGAKGSAYVVLLAEAESGPPVMTGKGTYSDQFVKTSEGWRIKKRIYTPGAFLSDVAPSAQ